MKVSLKILMIAFTSFAIQALFAFEDENALLQSLKSNSPFGNVEGSDKDSEKFQVADLSLQGIVNIDGKWMFSLFDKKQSKSVWVTVGEGYMECTLESYNLNSGVANMKFEGKSYPLTLKERDPLQDVVAKPVQQNQGQQQRGRFGGGRGNGEGGPPNMRNASPEERKKFLQMALERTNQEIAQGQNPNNQNNQNNQNNRNSNNNNQNNRNSNNRNSNR